MTMKKAERIGWVFLVGMALTATAGAKDWWKPYSPPATERENVFAFTEQPTVKLVGPDRHEISFAVQGYCDVTVAIVDPDPAKELVKGRGTVVRHLASGVLGANAPAPFQKNSLKQTLFWDGKDDLDWYHDAPNALTVRVELGLKPEFDRLLGAVSDYNIVGHVRALVASPEGMFVFFGALHRPRLTVRLYASDGAYVRTVWPPPADMPPEKGEGLWWVEYEPGKHAPIGGNLNPDAWAYGPWLSRSMNRSQSFRPIIWKNRIYFSCTGAIHGQPHNFEPRLHWIHTDGSTAFQGMEGRIYYKTSGPCLSPHLAVSPDGNRLYMLGMGVKGRRDTAGAGAVFRFDPNGTELAQPFVGNMRAPGSDAGHFNNPTDVALDSAERLYVTDLRNNRVQVFSPEGEHLKTIRADRPRAVQVHLKTGAVYVLHSGIRQGQSTARVTKFGPFPHFKELFHQDDMLGDVFALDSWSAKPRLWLGAEDGNRGPVPDSTLIVWEEQDRAFKKVLDFEEQSRRESGDRYHGRWPGSQLGATVRADPLRERVYVGTVRQPTSVFDLTTGRFLGHVPVGGNAIGSPLAFDKKGFMHVKAPYNHVARVRPERVPLRSAFSEQEQARLRTDRAAAEVPYDYGIELDGWAGAIQLHRVDYHPCGVGVNMRGDVAVVLNQKYAPRGAGYDIKAEMTEGAMASRVAEGGTGWGADQAYAKLMRGFEDAAKMDMEMPYIRRRPGRPLSGGTVWTWDSSGELRERMAVIAGQRVNGVQIDEDGFLYFSNVRLRLFDREPFLNNRAWRPGSDERGLFFTGGYIKTRGKDAHFLCKDAPVPMDEWPARPPDLGGGIGSFVRPNIHVWAEGAEWVVAGVAPMKPSDCMCYQIRSHLDWHKRSYIPERYRHSVGVFDTNGNLVLHIGQYGNVDSGYGPNSRIPVGGDGIATSSVRHIAGTDNFLVFDDWAERAIAMRLNYHAGATVAIGTP